MKLSIFLLLISVLIIGCFESLSNYEEVSLEEELKLKMGESVFLPNYDIYIKLVSVKDDSRCPIDAVCIWPGNAIVVFELKNSVGDRIVTQLNTYFNPKSTEFGNAVISLQDLHPYPKLDEIISQNEYVAVLEVNSK